MPSQTGKVDPHHPKVSGHRGNVLDIKWNPFDDFCIASCSEDNTVSVNHLRCMFTFYSRKRISCSHFYCLSCVYMFAVQVKIWDIPEHGVLKNITVPWKELQGHSRRVGLIEWHPTANNIIFSTGYDYQVIKLYIQCVVRFQWIFPSGRHFKYSQW